MRIEPVPYDDIDPELRERYEAGMREGRTRSGRLPSRPPRDDTGGLMMR